MRAAFTSGCSHAAMACLKATKPATMETMPPGIVAVRHVPLRTRERFVGPPREHVISRKCVRGRVRHVQPMRRRRMAQAAMMVISARNPTHAKQAAAPAQTPLFAPLWINATTRAHATRPTASAQIQTRPMGSPAMMPMHARNPIPVNRERAPVQTPSHAPPSISATTSAHAIA